MDIRRVLILYHEWAVRDCEHRFCHCRTVRTGGLASSIWIAARCLHGAEMMGGMFLQRFSFFIQHSQSRTVVCGTSCVAGPSQATRNFLHVLYISREAHSRPTSKILCPFSSLDSPTHLEITFSIRNSLKGKLFNFFSSKQLPSRSKTWLLLSPHGI